MKDVKSDTC